ncbi:MAG: DinB family protein [Gemmatimonadota bacterium]|nr:DinB family protein [Gemmatimonadota bacterium]
MDPQPSYVVTPLTGFSPNIGRLVRMMSYTRWTTVRAVAGLSVSQLDHLHDAASNSIGALLAHIAAVEIAYQRSTFGTGFASARDAEIDAALELGDRARQEVRGSPLEHYLKLLDGVRRHTLGELATRTDPWLDETTALRSGKPASNYFKWFHVFEDELNHRGQIRWLRRRLPGASD